MRLVQVRDVKARLSLYLREVEGGESIAITRHGRPVAILRPPDEAATDTGKMPADEWWAMALREGLVLPAEDRSALPETPPLPLQRLGRALARQLVRERRRR